MILYGHSGPEWSRNLLSNWTSKQTIPAWNIDLENGVYIKGCYTRGKAHLKFRPITIIYTTSSYMSRSEIWSMVSMTLKMTSI